MNSLLIIIVVGTFLFEAGLLLITGRWWISIDKERRLLLCKENGLVGDKITIEAHSMEQISCCKLAIVLFHCVLAFINAVLWTGGRRRHFLTLLLMILSNTKWLFMLHNCCYLGCLRCRSVKLCSFAVMPMVQ